MFLYLCADTYMQQRFSSIFSFSLNHFRENYKIVLFTFSTSLSIANRFIFMKKAKFHYDSILLFLLTCGFHLVIFCWVFFFNLCECYWLIIFSHPIFYLSRIYIGLLNKIGNVPGVLIFYKYLYKIGMVFLWWFDKTYL